MLQLAELDVGSLTVLRVFYDFFSPLVSLKFYQQLVQLTAAVDLPSVKGILALRLPPGTKSELRSWSSTCGGSSSSSIIVGSSEYFFLGGNDLNGT